MDRLEPPRWIALTLIAAFLVACQGASSSSSAAQPAETPIPTGMPPPRAPSSAEPSPSAADTEVVRDGLLCPDVLTSPPEGQIVPGALAEVITTELVIRSAPTVSSDSLITGRLDAPEVVYVEHGPIERDGYSWYLVKPAVSGDRGWIAEASRDGERWLRSLGLAAGGWCTVGRARLSGAPDAWTARVGVDGRIYLPGLLDADSIDQGAWAFDPQRRAWEDLSADDAAAQRPGWISDEVLRLPDGRAFVVTERGGVQAVDAAGQLLEPIYLARWPRMGAMGAVLPDGTLLIAGGAPIQGEGCAYEPPTVDVAGAQLTGLVRLVEAFDPDSGTWSTLAPLDAAYVSARPLSLDGGAYVVLTSDADVAVLRYQPAAGATASAAVTGDEHQLGCGPA